MDVYCPRCEEPCDIDEFHDVDGKTAKQARDIFFTQGCGVLFNGEPCEDHKSLRGQASAMLYDILGDDTDGIAAMMEDFEYAGEFE